MVIVNDMNNVMMETIEMVTDVVLAVKEKT